MIRLELKMHNDAHGLHNKPGPTRKRFVTPVSVLRTFSEGIIVLCTSFCSSGRSSARNATSLMDKSVLGAGSTNSREINLCFENRD